MVAGFRTGPFIPRKPPIPTPKTSSFAQQILLIGGTGADPASMYRLGNLGHTWQWPQNGVLDARANQPNFVLTRQNIFTGALLTAIQAAGASVRAVACSAFAPSIQEVAILFDSLATKVWYTDNYGADPVVWTAATGLPAGNGIDMAPGISFGEALACFVGPATRKADDGITFGSAGTPASQINDVAWEEQQRNIYLAAAAGGVMKTIDGGANWGYVRPHAVIGTTWPVGAVGRQVAILAAPVPAAAVASLLFVGKTKYRILGDNNTWADQNGAPPNVAGARLIFRGSGATYVMGARPGTMRYSSDTGAHWTTRAAPAPLTGFTDIDVDSGGTIWGVGHDGLSDGYIFKSIDNGVSWTQSLSFALNILSGHIAVNQANSLQICANYLSGGSGNAGFKFSTNGGASWTSHTTGDSTLLTDKASAAMQWIGSRLIVLITTNPGTHIKIRYTDDFGVTWTTGADIDLGAVGSDVNDFISGGAGGPLFVCMSKLSTSVTGCILRSNNHGSSWDELDSPLGALNECESLAYDVLSDTLFAIADNGDVKARSKASTTAAADWLSGWVSLPTTGQDLSNQSQAMVITY